MDEEYEYDVILGAHNKKSVLSKLNRKKLSKQELDEIMLPSEDPLLYDDY